MKLYNYKGLKFELDKDLGPVILLRLNNRKIFFCLCHRMDNRSVKFFGLEKYLCSRCLGILFGFIIAFILVIFNLEMPLILAILLMIPLLIDGFSQLLSIRESNNKLRLISGIMFGMSINAFYYI